ncbi:hypothetical protein EES42_28815 [Streptomyces sp. ADI95-17]|nr:hypothetical protein EES42_28815 [Streptomyces sp. ADI95-17]
MAKTMTTEVYEADPCRRARIRRPRTEHGRHPAANLHRADAHRLRPGRQAISTADSMTERLHCVCLCHTHPRERTAP